MKRLLGAIAAAMLLGAGCAHERGNQNKTDVPASPQASVDSSAQGEFGAGGAGTAGDLECAVIPGESASSSAVGGAGSQSDQSAVGGSAWDTSAADQSAIGGSASDEDFSHQSDIDGSESEAGAVDDTAIGGSAPDADTFEDTGMGGAGGGGG